ncbi:MAG: glycosyltransferase [Nitrospinaceae bacterium]|jgi:glycosyltransferase involved in cell wall biosynthesis|nr:glycosyltransferase [Nitrospinaceae bacterium]MBT6717533.1 glycosyltransferase [Nitrospina sp.]
MITVLHLITELGNGGAERMLYGLVRASDKKKISHVVVSMVNEGDIAEKIKILNIPYYTLDMKPGKPSIGSMVKLIRLLRRIRPNAIQTWLYHADLMGLVAGKISGIKRILWNIRCSDVDFSQYSRSLSALVHVLAWLSKIPDLIVINSEAGVLAHRRRGYRPKDWRVIPNGFDLNEFAPNSEARQILFRKLEIPDESMLVGMVARFDPLKDHHTFLRAAGEIGREISDVRYVLIGKDVTNENKILMEIIKEEHLEGKIFLLGEQNEIPKFMAGLDMLVSSSYSEGFSNVIGEAMASGVPCVVTDAGDSAFLVGDTGFVVEPKNPMALADAMRKLIKKGYLNNRKLGEDARNRIQKMFSMQLIVDKYEGLYVEVCSDKE